MKSFHKIKTNKGKIKKFKTKNEYDETDKMASIKKIHETFPLMGIK